MLSKTKKALRTLLDIKTPEKQQETTTETQQVEKKAAVPALMDQTVAPAVTVPATEVATLQPKLRTQTSTLGSVLCQQKLKGMHQTTTQQ